MMMKINGILTKFPIYILIIIGLYSLYYCADNYIKRYSYYENYIKKAYKKESLHFVEFSENRGLHTPINSRKTIYINPVSYFDINDTFFHSSMEDFGGVVEIDTLNSPYFKNYTFPILGYTKKHFSKYTYRLYGISKKTSEAIALSDHFYETLYMIDPDYIKLYEKFDGYKIALFNRLVMDENIRLKSTDEALEYLGFFLNLYYITDYNVVGGYDCNGRLNLNYAGFERKLLYKKDGCFESRLVIASIYPETGLHILSLWNIRLVNNGILRAKNEFIFYLQLHDNYSNSGDNSLFDVKCLQYLQNTKKVDFPVNRILLNKILEDLRSSKP